MSKGERAASGQPGASQPSPWLTIPLSIAMLGAVGYGLYAIYPQHVIPSKNPSFVDNIVDESVVIWGARLALLFGAVYVVVSVVGLMKGQRWLAQIGPFRTDAPAVEELSREADRSQEALGDALATIGTLEDRLLESDRALKSSRADIAALIDWIGKLERDREKT